MRYTYIKVVWHHDFDAEPTELFSEILDGREIRKVEIYRDGTMDFAGEQSSSGTSTLSQDAMPSLAEIAEDPQFAPEEIPRQRFEEVWRAAHTGKSRRPH